MEPKGRSVSWAATVLLAVVVASCGGSSSSTTTGKSKTSGGGSPQAGGSVTIVSGTAPESADPQGDFVTQGNELYSVVNTPLLTYRRANGDAGAEIVPGLAKALPQVSKDGKTYKFELRSGIHYSNGAPVKASDFKFAIERALKLNWRAKSFLYSIQGATEFDAGKSKDIPGIQTDDSTGEITVELSAPFGAIADVLALPGTAPMPQDTPMAVQNSSGTIGDGAYKWSKITPAQSYELVRNPKFDIPDLPHGHVDTVDFKVNSNVLANAQQVLQNQADIFDPGDTLPSSVVGLLNSQARGRYAAVPTNSSYYFFMAVNQKPFSSLKARQAVLYALDQNAVNRLDSGFLQPDCHLIPTGIIGHSDPKDCPYKASDAPGDLAKARALVQQSGMAGTSVTVWGQNRSPRKQYIDYLTDLLNKIGFKAQEKILNSQTYFQIVGNEKTKPQIGFGDWVQDFPNPWDFMQLFTSGAIQPQNATNYGYVRDKHIDQVVSHLATVPASQEQSVAAQWSAIDNYAVKQAYYANYGHEKFPKLYSDRLNFDAGILSVEYLTDITSLQLK
jgi:peptide/nickel transport system substrate-binding protein